LAGQFNIETNKAKGTGYKLRIGEACQER
jgi:hypothetical protein